jgi:MFS family permease
MATILLMGVGTVGIGLVPSYDSIGVWAPILLVALRCLQGIGVGGEWGGAVLLAMESGDTKKQGFRGSFPQAAATVGVGAANLAFLAVSLSMPTEAFLSWGWRIPFVSSVVLVLVGLWIRNAVPETSAFQKARDSGLLSKRPLLDVIRRSPVEIILAALMKSGEMIPIYVFIAFILSYGTANLSYSRNSLLLLVSVSALLASALMIYVGAKSDKLGHERTFVIGASVMAVFGFVYFLVIDTGSLVGASIVILVSLIPYGIMSAPEPVLIARNFPAETRYSGASLGFNLAGIVGGGPAPFVATWLVASFGSMAVAVYIAIFCLIAIAAAKALTYRSRTRYGTTNFVDTTPTAPRPPEHDKMRKS